MTLNLISLYSDYGSPELWDSNSPVACVCDQMIPEHKRTGKQILMLVEPRCIIPDVYEWVENNAEQVSREYEYVFSFDTEILKRFKNSNRIIYGTYTCQSHSEKTKGISMLCSNKNFCVGHQKRQNIANRIKGSIDLMGTITGRYCEYIEAYQDYKFNVAIENCKQDYYFTEKLCNCFANRVIPIYYGANKIDEFFDTKGIIQVDDVEEIPDIIRKLNVDREYEKRLDSIERNYGLVKQYQLFDKWFFNEYYGILHSLLKR